MKKYIVLWMVVIVLCGCDNFLTVKPKSDIQDKDLFKTAEGCEDALYGVYSELGDPKVYGRMMTYYLPELLAQSYEPGSTSESGSEFTEVMNYKHDLSYARGLYGAAWTSMYEVIGHVNNIIVRLEEKDAATFRYQDYYLGEALGLRGFLHFDLVRLFAPAITSQPSARGIPYVKVWNGMVTPFSSVVQVYQNVFSDLKRAEELLEKAEQTEEDSSSFLEQRELHFNLEAVRATLARVYWTENKLDSARIYAEKVIDTRKYELAGMKRIQNLTASVVAQGEAVWGLNQQDPLKKMADDFYSQLGIFPRSDVLKYYLSDGQDMRQYWFRDKKSSPIGRLCFLKLFDEDAYLSALPAFHGIPGINMIRIPEMYYIMAEALIENDPEKATAYFDKVAISRGRVALADMGKQVTLQDINEERQREYFGEGYEWHNMKRQMRDLYIIATTETVPGTDELYTLTIPDEEFDYRY